MSATTIQIRVTSTFKTQIKKTASMYDMPMATFIKLLVGDFIRAKKNVFIGTLKKQEEREIDLAYKDYLKAKKQNKLKPIETLFKDAGLQS